MPKPRTNPIKGATTMKMRVFVQPPGMITDGAALQP